MHLFVKYRLDKWDLYYTARAVWAFVNRCFDVVLLFDRRGPLWLQFIKNVLRFQILGSPGWRARKTELFSWIQRNMGWETDIHVVTWRVKCSFKSCIFIGLFVDYCPGLCVWGLYLNRRITEMTWTLQKLLRDFTQHLFFSSMCHHHWFQQKRTLRKSGSKASFF